MFENFDARTFGAYYKAINDGLPPEECGIDLTAEEKEHYLKLTDELAKDRSEHPGVPICYQDTFNELDW